MDLRATNRGLETSIWTLNCWWFPKAGQLSSIYHFLEACFAFGSIKFKVVISLNLYRDTNVMWSTLHQKQPTWWDFLREGVWYYQTWPCRSLLHCPLQHHTFWHRVESLVLPELEVNHLYLLASIPHLCPGVFSCLYWMPSVSLRTETLIEPLQDKNIQPSAAPKLFAYPPDAVIRSAQKWNRRNNEADICRCTTILHTWGC